MSKKQLSVTGITNELAGASLFFASRSETIATESTPPAEPAKSSQVPVSKPIFVREAVKPAKVSTRKATPPPRHRDTTIPQAEGRQAATKPEVDTLEVVRKAVKELGKEAATHRFTPAEKRAVADLIYTFRRRGIRTSENEIARIALNYLIVDFHRQGKDSVLENVLNQLNS